MQAVYMILYIVAGYLIGSIPPAYILGRIIKKTDIRNHGSGNVGFTNALRVLGVVPGIIVLIFDIAKGFLPVWLIGYLGLFAGTDGGGVSVDLSMALCGIAVICGHNWPLYIGFRGGKGVATGCGIFLAMAPAATGLCILLWIIMMALSNIVSLSSIIAVSALPFIMLFVGESKIIIGIAFVLAIVTVVRHKENIRRLIRGEERTFLKRKKQSDENGQAESQS